MRWPFIRRTEYDRVFTWYLEELHAKSSAEMVFFDEREEYIKRIAELEFEVSEWEDFESPRRQEIMEETVLSVGDGDRSELDMRESQIDMLEAALERCRSGQE